LVRVFTVEPMRTRSLSSDIGNGEKRVYSQAFIQSDFTFDTMRDPLYVTLWLFGVNGLHAVYNQFTYSAAFILDRLLEAYRVARIAQTDRLIASETFIVFIGGLFE
jgi:hypothetical protein